LQRLRFTTTIDAPREHVWKTMLDQETYRRWTDAFTEGSYYEGSWDQGERIVFLAPSGEGMVAEIAESRKPEYISIRHLGMTKGGVEDTESEAVRAWTPAYENYTFSEKGGATELTVEMDVVPEYESFMAETWPKALAKLKEISERG
jgi:uncharacterized protein YndB with AHSA1/START domain